MSRSLRTGASSKSARRTLILVVTRTSDKMAMVTYVLKIRRRDTSRSRRRDEPIMTMRVSVMTSVILVQITVTKVNAMLAGIDGAEYF